MNHHSHQPDRPGDDPLRDDRLQALLHDAVSGVAPRDGLAEVRRRTRRRTSSRRWAPAVLGAGAVAATVVAATFVVRGFGDAAPEDEPSVAASPGGEDRFVAGLYFLAGSATGDRLHREFQALPEGGDPAEQVLIALERLTAGHGPDDPDYRTLWPAGSFADVAVEDDRVVVALGTTAALEGGDGPGALGVQQAVYTAEAVLGEALPVAFEWQDQPAARVLGTPVGTLVERDRGYNVTAPVNISDPGEGAEVDDVLVTRGTMAEYVSEVRWTVTAATGERAPVADGVLVPGADGEAAGGAGTLGVSAWETEVDVAGLEPGDYVLTVATTTTGQTSDTPADYSDTRTFTVR
ncbi:GerMN domain-containing protein [Nocardioides sp. TF02-7]|uniref:GerMN domain-containing protein n=1 Tax=Nocardioides sp. TF02-7 TaxID=2917724 RepID=UPI001F057E7F|nr:GerMN domain-containing protein [Nocardioides sp. TF02-7]UMG92910.1 GerMN domain-containing protein [Nocardioides sp. TF02-7]